MASRVETDTEAPPATPQADPAQAEAEGAAAGRPDAADGALSAADRASAATPKTRSRNEGAAVALEDMDRRLLNLMQGSFPLEPRPYASVAKAAEIPEEEAMRRVQHLLDERIVRQVTPIYDTRALGYSSMLVAAKVDPEHPWRAAKIVNSHPGVSHNYLRNHDFNMWFTLATEPDS